MGDEYISKEEVLNLIDTAFESGAFDGRYAYENLIDAVQNLPSVTPRPETHEKRTKMHACVCISRQAAIDAINHVVIKFPGLLKNRQQKIVIKTINLTKNAIENALIKLPSVEPERKPGKWIRGKYWNVGIGMGEQYGYFYKCSECGKEVKGGYTECTDRFCKSCGAKMEADTESEEV